MSDAAAAPVTPAASPSPAPEAPSAAPESAAPAAAAASPKPAAAPTDKAPAAPKPEPRRVKVKVDGEEMEVPEDELIRGYQTRQAAARRFEEFAKARKEFEAQQAALKKRLEDPKVQQAAQEWGVEPEEAAAILRVQELMQREQMSPEARAAADERKRREEVERKLKEVEEAKTKEQMDREVEGHKQKLNREIVEAAKEIGLPPVPEVGRLMIGHMQTLAKAGLPFDAKESARYALESAQAISRSFVKAMSDEQLESFLGKPVIDRILKRSVQLARGEINPPPPTPAPVENPDKPKAWALTPEEWRKKYGT